MIVTAKQYHGVTCSLPRPSERRKIEDCRARGDDYVAQVTAYNAQLMAQKRELIESLDPERRDAVDRLMKACGAFPDRTDKFCAECEHFHVVPCQSPYEGECRIGPPSRAGFRRVRPGAWCAHFKRGARRD
jgi:hypothetical protein